MAAPRKVKCLSTVKKDEAAFYLSELARGLLRGHITLRAGVERQILCAFDAIRVDFQAREGLHDSTLAIRLSWRRRLPAGGPEPATEP